LAQTPRSLPTVVVAIGSVAVELFAEASMEPKEPLPIAAPPKQTEAWMNSRRVIITFSEESKIEGLHGLSKAV